MSNPVIVTLTIVATILVMVVAVAVPVLLFKPKSTSKRRVVLLIQSVRWQGDADRVMLDYLIKYHVSPVSTPQVHVLAPTSHEQLVTQTQDALSNFDVPVVLGVLPSDELEVLLPVATAFPDTVFLSTSSTAPDLARPDNVFRLTNDDATTAPFMGRLLREHLASGVPASDSNPSPSPSPNPGPSSNSHSSSTSTPNPSIHIVYDTQRNMWSEALAFNMAGQLGGAYRLHMASVDNIQDQIDHIHNGDVVMLLRRHAEDTIADLHALSHLDIDVVLGDVFAFADMRGVNLDVARVFALTAYGMLDHAPLGRTVFRRDISPFLLGLKAALDMGAGVLHATATDGDTSPPSYLKNTAIHTTRMLNNMGDRRDVHVAMVQWTQHDGWRIVRTAAQRPALGASVCQYTQHVTIP